MPPTGRRAAPWTLTSRALLWLAISSPAVAQQASPNLDDYVRAHAFGARNDEVAALFDSSSVPNLVLMLDSDAPYWSTVVTMLGVIGDERAVDALIAFVSKPCPNPALADVYENARGAAIVRLGDLVHRIGSERALTYLVESLTPDAWRKRNVQGAAPWTKSFEEYDGLLSEYAIHGLAYSGHARAGDALRSLQRSPTPEQARFRKGLDDTLERWIEVYDLVAERGLDGGQAFWEMERRRSAALGTEVRTDR
jgi:hypothetical protein